MTNYIHYDSERTDYTVTKDELNSLENGASTLWKDVCLVSISMGVPLLINGIAEIKSQVEFKLTLTIFLNVTLGIIGIVLSIIFAIAWYKSGKNLGTIIKGIKNKPRMEVPPEMCNVGSIGGNTDSLKEKGSDCEKDN